MNDIFNSLWGRLLLAFAAPVVLFLGASLVAYVTIHRLLVALDNERHTEEIISNAYKVKESIASMAAAKRAHHLTGEDIHKKHVENQYQEILDDLRHLRSLVAADSSRQKEIDAVEKKIKGWYSDAQMDFALREKVKALEPIINLLHLPHSIELMESIRASMNKLIHEENQILQDRHQAVREVTRESVWAITIAISVTVLLSVAIAILSAHGITKPIHHLQHAFADLRHGRFETIVPYGPTETMELIRGFNLAGIALAERTTLLETSELRYRTVVGTTSTLLWTTDTKGNNREMQGWCHYTGQHEDDVAGDGWLEAVHPEDREGFINNWHDAVAHKDSFEEEVRIRGAGGDYRHFSCRSVPIFDANDNIIEWVRICVDITEQKHEEALRQEKEAAEAANRAKSEFLAKMSHELRTPLNAVIGMSNMLFTQRFGALNDKQLDYLADITQAGEHLLELINDILDLSKVEAGRMDLEPEPIAVNKTIDLVVSTLAALTDNKNLHLEKHLLKPDGTIITDVARFKQILFNLLSNAVKFTPEGGTITIRADWVTGNTPVAQSTKRESAHAIRIEVEDTGIGIQNRDQHKIGQEFFQANRAPHRAIEGTGLGLALTQRLVSLMNGKLWFTSEADKGSCFSVVLPLYLEGRKKQQHSLDNKEEPVMIQTE